MDGGVERLLDFDLRLAVAHAIVAYVKLDVPRVGELHVGLKYHHYHRVITQNIHISMNYKHESPTHKSLWKLNFFNISTIFPGSVIICRFSQLIDQCDPTACNYDSDAPWGWAIVWRFMIGT